MRVFGSKMSQGPRKHLWVVKSQVQFCVANMAWHVKEYIGCVGSDRRSRGIHLKKAHFIFPPPTHSWKKASPPEISRAFFNHRVNGQTLTTAAATFLEIRSKCNCKRFQVGHFCFGFEGRRERHSCCCVSSFFWIHLVLTSPAVTSAGDEMYLHLKEMKCCKVSWFVNSS